MLMWYLRFHCCSMCAWYFCCRGDSYWSCTFKVECNINRWGFYFRMLGWGQYSVAVGSIASPQLQGPLFHSEPRFVQFPLTTNQGGWRLSRACCSGNSVTHLEENAIRPPLYAHECHLWLTGDREYATCPSLAWPVLLSWAPSHRWLWKHLDLILWPPVDRVNAFLLCHSGSPTP